MSQSVRLYKSCSLATARERECFLGSFALSHMALSDLRCLQAGTADMFILDHETSRSFR